MSRPMSPSLKRRVASSKICGLSALLLVCSWLGGCAAAWGPITQSGSTPQTDALLGRSVREARHLQTLNPGAGTDPLLPDRQTASAALSLHGAMHHPMGTYGGSGMGGGMNSGINSGIGR